MGNVSGDSVHAAATDRIATIHERAAGETANGAA